MKNRKKEEMRGKERGGDRRKGKRRRRSDERKEKMGGKGKGEYGKHSSTEERENNLTQMTV